MVTAAGIKISGENVPTITRYDHAERLAFLEAPGEISRDEAVDQFRTVCAALADYDRREPGTPYGVLLDTTSTATVPAPADIVQVLEEICGRDSSASARKWAILTAARVHYGMGRLFQAHAESRGIQVAVFTTRATALEWLSRSDAG
jgi:hypothetical protein